MAVEMEANTPLGMNEREDVNSTVAATLAGGVDSSAAGSNDALLETEDVDMEVESTQRFDDEEEIEEVIQVKRQQTIDEDYFVDDADVNESKAAPTLEEEEEDDSLDYDFAGVSASARPFARAFGTVWSHMAGLGWQTAQGPGTEFVSMPGTQFFNFRPNINVFDGKGKACWKWLSLASENANDTDASEELVWSTLWRIAEKEFSWYTMSSGDETWFVKPNTRFEQFQPNVTIFQSKKRAVLQALAVQNVRIELGDSVEGEQVIDFAASPADEEPTETKSKVKKEKSKAAAADMFTTPPPKRVPAAAVQSSSKKSAKATPSSSKKAGGSAKKATPGKSPKTPKNAKKAAEAAAALALAAKAKKSEPALNFHVPEFKCTFGHVTGKLKERGWYYKAGSFEYDYFSPDYTKETAILGGNYFQSSAELESFLKDSNLWTEIENELRDEHAEMVEELRYQAERKRQLNKDRAAKRATPQKGMVATPSTTKTKASRSPAKAKKKSASTTPPAELKRKSSFASELRSASEVKISMGKVVERLVKRGWHYKPGRFEYDYFKPNVNAKTAIVGEDYFQSLAELETYLKTTGLWDEIAQELQEEFSAAQERAARGESDDGSSANEEEPVAKSYKKPRVDSTAGNQSSSVQQELAKEHDQEQDKSSEPLEPAAAKLTNDIWGNSHQFDFEKY